MSSINAKWNAWIYRSVAKHFSDLLSTHKLFIEGQERDTSGSKEWIEIRCDGPFFDRTSPPGRYKVWIEINLLIVVTEQTDRYRIQALTGEVANAFRPCLTIKKYGDPADDIENDESLVGTLDLKPRKRTDDIEVSYFGKVRPDTPQHQASVEGHYRGFLEGA